jgi:hypothetical protein
MARYAMVEDATGLVTGVYEFEDGHTLVLDTDPPTANPGGTYNPTDGSFAPPPEPPEATHAGAPASA